MAESGEKLHILMVDDAPSVLLIMTRALRNLSAEIITATTGEEALTKSEEHDFALILLDMHLPDMNGLQVARELSRRETTRHIPIIFITAARDDETLLFEGYELGAADYLYKPVHPSILLSKVTVFCRLKEQNSVIARHIRQLEKEMEERRQAELRQRESDMRYRILSELSPVAVCVHAGDEIRYVNRAMLNLLQGDERENLIGAVPRTLVTEGEREQFDAFNAEIEKMSGTHEHIETILLRPDGSGVEVEIRGACVPFEDGWGVQLALQDITERKQLEQQLKRSAITDGLTGIPNRRCFDEKLESEWRRALREKQSLAIILADVDNFKQFNDNYGHQAGDDCLRCVAEALSQAAQRPSDLIARYGGEEFAAILPNTDAAGAREVAEHMRTLVYDLGLAHAHSQAAEIVTVSLGAAAVVPTDVTTPAMLLRATDEALYSAKESGRNRVTLAEVAVEWKKQ